MISIVSPVWNEEAALEELCRRLAAALEPLGEPFEIILVNDGSSDRSFETIRSLAAKDPRIVGLDLSRNFGQQAALSAGLDFARGDAVILMDSDLQDMPEATPSMVAKWKEGFDVVYAVREKRKESLPMRIAFKAFYRLQSRIVNVSMPMDAGIFSLMDRCVVDALRTIPERNRYLPGIRAWVGYRQTGVPVERAERYDKKSRVGIGGLISLALNGIFGFSTLPLRIATSSSIVIGFASLCVLLFVLYNKLFTHNAIPGWASSFGTVLLLGALELFALGLIGEYIGRIYDEVKKRPLYLVREVVADRETIKKMRRGGEETPSTREEHSI